MDLRGRTALVTGATGGLGHAIVRALHREGTRLVLTGRRTDVLEPLAAEVGGTALPCDLADPADVDRLLAGCGDIDVLVANAALPASGRLEAFTAGDVAAALDVNLRAPMVMTRALLDGWVARGSGHAVYISSLSGKIATGGSSVYSATKFGLRGFAQGLRDELHGTGIGVSVVNPGFIRDAGMFADSGAALPKGIGTRTPEQVAAAVVRAVRDDKGDLDVAPAFLRFSAKLNGLAPELVAGLGRRLGAGDIAGDIAAGQQERR
ncbi:MAG: SDR family NAD(P)-dependent oxidoreductase [Actinobacteria bacterium]|nr:SDR family NAD(P)-dependent oxidoreductase [Actinomycetota bacterium]MCA1720085.1 SDR family NAD(P)-dependent oxidoreductase [Actinomycetota bacterium]